MATKMDSTIVRSDHNGDGPNRILLFNGWIFVSSKKVIWQYLPVPREYVRTTGDRPSAWLLPTPTVPGNRPRSVISPPLRIFGVVRMGRVEIFRVLIMMLSS